MQVYRGHELKNHISKILDKPYEKRDVYESLHDFTRGQDKLVCCLYGLRRTGKTTMMAQCIRELSDYDRTILIDCEKSDDAANIYKRIKEENPAFVFIDEATFADGFIDSCNILADRFAVEGMRIVISGTDSLGLSFALGNSLYDRATTIHTSYISFKEFNRLLGSSLDDYIQYGGTLTDGRKIYNTKALGEHTNEAIVENILHSLEQRESGRRFGKLLEPYNNNDLPTYIRKVLEYDTKEFTAAVINSTFKSHDLGSVKNLMRKNLIDPGPLKDPELTEAIREGLGIKDIFTPADKVIADEIIKYLESMEVIYRPNDQDTYFIQPGMRYCQAIQLSGTLIRSGKLGHYSRQEQDFILDKIDSDIKGRMLEGIMFVQLSLDETVSSLYGIMGHRDNETGAECDVVLYDKETYDVIAVEVKHSSNSTPEQTRHLRNSEYMDKLSEDIGGRIIKRVVAYMGETHTVDENGIVISYINAEEILKDPHILLAE